MPVTDNFNRADGGLGANWTTDSSFTALAIVSNTCKGGTGGAHNVAVYTAAGTAAADQYGQFKVTATGGFIGPVLRSNGAGTFYTCYYSSSLPTIFKWIGGSATNITASASAATPTVNDVIYFEAVGSALTMKVNGVVKCTATDSSITGAGYTGIDIFDTAAAVDDFEGGSLAVDVSVSLTDVAADPQIGTGTITGALLSNGDPVTPWWPDMSGTAHDGTIYATPSPTLRTNALNTKPVVRFTTNEGRVRGNTGLSGTLGGYNFTVIYIARVVTPSVGRVFTALYPAANFLVGYHTAGYASCYDNGWVNAGVGWPAPPTAWTMWGALASHDGTNYLGTFYINGVASGTTTGGAGLQTGYNLSGYSATGTEETCDCEVAELLIYNHKLVDADRTNIEKYFADKYGLTAPSGTVVDPASISGLNVWLRADSLVGDVMVFLAGVGADPQVGTGTVTISSEVVTPPLQGAPGAYWDWWPKAEEKVYLTGVAADPQIGNGSVYALQSAEEILERYRFPQVEVPREPKRIPPLVVREPAKPPPPPPMIFVHLVGWQPMSAIGTGRVKLSYQIDEDEMLVLIAMLADL